MTQNKAYSIQNTAKVWNQEHPNIHRKVNLNIIIVSKTKLLRVSYQIIHILFLAVLWLGWPGYWQGRPRFELRQVNIILLSLLVLTIFYLLIVSVKKLVHLITLNDTYTHTCTHMRTHTHSVGFLWMKDRPVSEASTWQHTTLTNYRHLCPRRYSNPHLQGSRGGRTTHYNARPRDRLLITFFSSKSSRPAVWTTQPTIQMVPVFSSGGISTRM